MYMNAYSRLIITLKYSSDSTLHKFPSSHVTDCYLAGKRNVLLIAAVAHMHLKSLILSDRS